MCGDMESWPNHNFPETQYLCKERGISMYHQNIRGLSTNYESLCEILDIHYFTLRNSDINEEDIEKLGDSGGVAFYIKQRLK